MAAPADLQGMQARAMQMQAKCGSDRDCLMREAMTLSSAQVARGDTSVQARLQGYGNAVQACERRHAAGAAREACIAQARRAAGGGEDDGPPDEVVETPYLHFSGRAAYGLDVATKIDERIEGSFNDGQGVVPFTQTTQAGAHVRDDSACPLVQAVLDTRTGRPSRPERRARPRVADGRIRVSAPVAPTAGAFSPVRRRVRSARRACGGSPPATAP